MKKILIAFLLITFLTACGAQEPQYESDSEYSVPDGGTYMESQRDYDRFHISIIVDEETGERFMVADYGNGVGIVQIQKPIEETIERNEEDGLY